MSQIQTSKFRNTDHVIRAADFNYRSAVNLGLMQVAITERAGKRVKLSDGRRATEFINCSYLGLDLHEKVQNAYRAVDDQWGVNFSCARSRFSIEPLIRLEEELSEWLGGRVVTFPSVTTTHMAVLPLVASGALLGLGGKKICFIFDRLAHSSMQFLKPLLAQEARVVTISHNSLEQLVDQVKTAKEAGEVPVFVCDGIYSMGGIAPISELLSLADEMDFYLYIDDAHGTSIFGHHGEGPILSQLDGKLPARIILTFSLSKGFGTNGGGVLFPSRFQETLTRTYGQIYAFSAALDFSVVMASLASLELHRNGTVRELQTQLRSKVNLYDQLRGSFDSQSPIRMVKIGNETKAIEACDLLVSRGYFTSVVFFPIVAKQNAQLRVSLAANHSDSEIRGLVEAIAEVEEIIGVTSNQQTQVLAAN